MDFEESDVIGLLSECDKQFQATGTIDDVTKCEVGNIARSKSATKLTKQVRWGQSLGVSISASVDSH